MQKVNLFSVLGGVLVLFVFIFIGVKSATATLQVEVYPGPGVNTYQSDLYSVEVNDGSSWLSSYTYKYGRVSNSMWHQNQTPTVSFTTFGTTGSTQVRISKISGSITSVQVSPKSKNIPVQITSGQAVLTLNTNDKVWVTVDGDDSNPLFVFADGLKPAVPSGATYFGPGIVNISPSTSNHYYPANNETIYLDGGAWVKGNIDVRGKTGVKVMGPGVLSGELWTSEFVNGLSFEQKKDYMMIVGDWGSYNSDAQDITIVASPTYNFYAGTRNATNVKLLSPWFYSTDGFQVVPHVDKVFAFVGDNVFFPIWAGVNNQNVTITNSFAGTTTNSVFAGGYWGNDAANTYTAFAANIDIKTYNSDAWVPYGAPLTPAAFQIWVDNTDTTKGYSNQNYQNIRIEGNLDVPLAMVKNMPYPWDPNSPNPPLGNSYNLIFKNITLEGTQKYLSEVKGYDANNGFHNVLFDNVKINGNTVNGSNFASYFDVNNYVSNISFDHLALPTASLSANPTIINSTGSSTLSWTTSGAWVVSIDNGVGTVASSGTTVVAPTSTTTYTLTATNPTGSVTSQATITVDNVLPTTAVTFPTNGSYVNKSSPVTITATASDNIGVQRVEFHVNGTLRCTDTTAPYSCVWNVPGGAGVNYNLKTKAFDQAGNKGVSAIVTVTSQ